ncbi:MAG: PAS domain-containing protein, partial [Gammaproteobacteria bacterium]
MISALPPTASSAVTLVAGEMLETLGEIALVVGDDSRVHGASVAGSSAAAQAAAAVLVGHPLNALLPPDAAALLGDAAARACAHGHTRSFVLGPDARFGGDTFEVTVQPLTLAAGARQALCRLSRQQAGGPTLGRFGTRDFELALAHAHIAWFERDLVTNEAICSRSLAELYGFTRRDGRFSYAELIERIVPEDRPRHVQHCAEVVEGQRSDLEARVLRYRVQHPTRGIRHFEVRYRNIFDDGRPRAIGLAFDVTDLRETEARLRESIEWLDLAVTSTSMVVWELDLASGNARTSANASGFLGLPGRRTLWMPQDILPQVFAADRERVAAELAALRTHHRPLRMQHRFARADGTVVWVESRAQVRHESGGPARCTGVTIDISEAVRTAEELRQSEQRLTRAMRQAQLAPFEWNVDAGRLDGPAGLAQIFGLPVTTGPWPVRDFLAAIHPDDRDAIAAVVQAPPREHARFTLEYRIVLPDGTVRHIENRQVLARTGADGDTVFDGVVIDVTERVALEQSRVEMEQRLRMLARMVPGMVYQFRIGSDGAWSFPYASEGALKVLRLTPRAIETDAQAVLAIIHADDLARVRQSIERAAQHLDLWREEFRVVDADGSVRWILGQAAPARPADGVLHWYGHMMDVTARKDAELALRENEEHLKLALSAANLVSWFWNVRDDTFTTPQTIDPHFRDSNGRVTLQAFIEAVHPDDRADVLAAFDDKIRERDGSLLDIEFRALADDGSERWRQAKARAWFDDTGDITGFYGITADITERHAAQREQEQLRNQLQHAQKMESIGLLTGGIAHDFNNIVSSILGYSSLALRRFPGDLPPKLLEYLHEIHTAGERARDMTRQLLTFSRTQPADSIAVDAGGVLAEAMRLLRPMMPSSVTFRIEVAPDLPPALADAGQLQQVIVNLCINARDAVDNDGNVLIRLARRAFARAQCDSCHGEVNGEFVVLSVADDGPGIPADDRARVFEPFYTTKRTGRGTGMGLAMVHGIVHAHHGHIVLDSQPGTGARFDILLPLAAGAVTPPAPAAGAAPAASGVPQRHAPRVFVVDDEPSVAAFLGELMELQGYHTSVFTTPQDALAAFRAAPDTVALVITDQTMPGITGLGMARELLALRPTLPIVLVSGYSATVREAEAIAAGIRVFLPKPIDEERLLTVVA